MRSRTLRLAAVSFGLVVGLLLTDASLRLAWTNPWLQAGRVIILREQLPNQNRTFVLDSDLLPHRVASRRTDGDGLLLPGDVPGNSPAITVAFLGGSTTECGLLPEESRFPYLVGKKLGAQHNRAVRVLNAGTSGSNTHNLLNVLLNKIVKYSPDVVVLMEAVNDAGLLAEQGGYQDAMITEATPGVADLLSRRSYVVGLIRETRARWLVNREFNDIARRGGADWDAANFQVYDDRERRLRANESEYLLRLRLFVDMARSMGAIPVLMTQPYYQGPRAVLSPAERRTWLGGLEYMDRFNEHIRTAAAEKHASLIDLARSLEPRREYYYDNIHYSVRGAEAVAEVVAQRLVEILTRREK